MVAKYIELTKFEFALVDEEDYAELSRYNWYAQTRLGGFYAARRDNRIMTYMHRVIMGNPEGMVVDHINGDTLDNRRSNLRICTQAQNTKNRVGVRNTVSGVKGVVWCRCTNRWRAQIKVDYKNIALGRFDTLEEAIKARQDAEIKYFGNYSREVLLV